MLKLAPILEKVPEDISMSGHEGSGGHDRQLHQALPFHGGGRIEPESITVKSEMANHDSRAVEIRSDECIDHFHQRRGLNNGIEFLKHQRFKRFKLMIKEAFGKIQPLLSLVLMVALLLAIRLIREMIVVPSQNQCIDDLPGHELKKVGMNRFGLLKRREDIIKMRADRLKQFRQLWIIDLFDQAEKEGQL